MECVSKVFSHQITGYIELIKSGTAASYFASGI
jgi:hypothetical protein